ncbi:MAG: hypothetical protein COU65_02445 [Candidatus Pacebacteria bacterium CG10_big_fil_rev_8_21_14_0_10_42_12]|nr:MAG: hypothetical protein COU65_02445 [Candidatus Pacebacteria bacterium CG10_big_fil_rev_8_21_14_0_10_42_12]
MIKPWMRKHHSTVDKIAKKLHWPHQETKAHKALRLFQSSILYLALILFGYLLAQLKFLA